MRLSFSSRAVSIRIGTADRVRMRAGKIESALARHHHIENEEIEFQAVELGAGVRAPSRRW